jgi:predicted enzyme related to lactoylglutathione lyase
MITGYQDFYYNVSDINKAIQFYQKALGMKVIHADEYWASLEIGNCRLGLHDSEGEEIPKTPRNSHGQLCGGTLTIASTEIESDRLLIETFGGAILGEMDAPWGHMLVFEDLDGNVLKLMKAK